jgi:hypothetical protein
VSVWQGDFRVFQKSTFSPSLQSKFFSRQNSFFQNTKEKFGGKKIYFAKIKKLHHKKEEMKSFVANHSSTSQPKYKPN